MKTKGYCKNKTSEACAVNREILIFNFSLNTSSKRPIQSGI